MTIQRNKLFGTLLSEGISSIARRQQKTISRVEDDIASQLGFSLHTVQRWKRGYVPVEPTHIAFLVQHCYESGRVDREWAQKLLNQANYLDKKSLLQQIYPVRDQVDIEGQPQSALHNLPRPEHTQFFGREAELTRLMRLLSPEYGAHLISIDGIGGVGKTALIIEMAYRCLCSSNKFSHTASAPKFDAIVFASAKSLRLSSNGILTVHQSQRTLSDIFRVIAHVLNLDIVKTSVEEQFQLVWTALGHQQTLLIVDNLETLENPQDVLSFLFETPQSVKVVVTTRERVAFSPIHLDSLLERDAIQLIRYEAEQKGVDLNDRQVLELYRSSSGIPAAIVYAIGRIAVGHYIDIVIDQLASASGEVASYCFRQSVESIRSSAAYSLLMARSMFPKSPTKEALAYVAGLQGDLITAHNGLTQLQKLSLVSQGDNRYRILPLTCEYAIAELQNHPKFEQEARKRWVDWYLTYTKNNGGKDLAEWHIRFDHLDEEWDNLLAVFDWCTAQELYEEMKAFWLEGRVNTFANLYGYWDDRLTCLGWIVMKAKKYEEWPVVVKAMSSLGWTLTVKGEREKAKLVLDEAWELRDRVPPDFLHRLANHQAVWYIYQRDYKTASHWLKVQEILITQTMLVGPALECEQILNLYHQGVIYYEQTVLHLATTAFQQAIRMADAIKWLRLVANSQNLLACVYLKQGKTSEAESLIKASLAIAERNKDQRCAALCKKSYALLELGRGSKSNARTWAAQALSSFIHLGMKLEVAETRQLVETLE